MTGQVFGTVRDEKHLRTLPDGTIITWLRIPGDETSEAVAFVRQQMETQEDADGRQIHAGRVTWISPGGWAPHTVESAGVTFPCQVVRLGEFNHEHYLGEEIPLLTSTLEEINSGVLMHGGSWAREKALECASRLLAPSAGDGISPRDAAALAAITMTTADQFEQWLQHDPGDEPGPTAHVWNRVAKPGGNDLTFVAPSIGEQDMEVLMAEDLAGLGVPNAAAIALALSRGGWRR